MATQRNMAIRILLAATARTTTASGSAVDLQSYIHPGGREMKVLLDCGEAGGTSPTLNVKIQESDITTASGFSDISGAVFTEITSTAGNEEIHFRTNKRYVRAVATLAGTSPAYTFGVYLLNEKRLA